MTGARYTDKDTRAGTIRYHLWLKFDEAGNISLTRSRPQMSAKERGMSCALTVPLSLFKTPELRAEITIVGNGVSKPTIDIRAAEQQIAAALGVDVVFTVKEPE